MFSAPQRCASTSVQCLHLLPGRLTGTHAPSALRGDACATFLGRVWPFALLFFKFFISVFTTPPPPQLEWLLYKHKNER